MKSRTNIVLDDSLLRKAMKQTGLKTKRAVVEKALNLLVATTAQARIRDFRGKLSWEGDLERERIDRE